MRAAFHKAPFVHTAVERTYRFIIVVLLPDKESYPIRPASELRSGVKVEVAVLSSTSLIAHMVSVDVKQH